MKKVLATGLNGMYETTANLGSMYCFSRMRKNMDTHCHSNWIDAIERNFVDDDNLSLQSFPSITNTPPDVMVEVSAILCMSCPKITREALSIAEHYGIPIVVTSTGIDADGENSADMQSYANLQIMEMIAQTMVVFYCEDDKRLIDALEFVLSEKRSVGLHTVKDLD